MDGGSEQASGPPRRLRVSTGQLERILDVLAEAVTVTEEDGGLVFANKAALRRMQMDTLEHALRARPEELLGRYEITTERGDALDPDDLPGRRLLRGEPAEPLMLRLIDRGTGELLWTLVKATLFEDAEGRRLAVNVLEDLTEVTEQQLRARFLLRASEVLTSSLDFEETLQQMASLAVPEIADWCAVDLLDGGAIRQVALAHVDPDLLAVLRAFREHNPPGLRDEVGVGAVLRTGVAEFHPVLPPERLAGRARDADHRRLLLELGLRSLMIVPMRSRDRVLGAISFAAAESAGAFYQADLEFARDIAARAAHAAENGRLYRERTETALTLQRSLRPYRLPDLPGWRIASVYRPGEHAVEIGGDFYDVFPAERGFTVIVGDVTGKGVPAATLTALTRHSARAAALQGLGPGAILRLLNRLLLEQPELSLVTAVVARVHQGARGASLTVASAGHPLPLRHRAGEDPVEVGRPGVLLGYVGQESWPEQTVPLQPRDTVLLYTDGVTDTVGADGRFGEARLRSALSASPSDPEVILGQIEAAVRAFERGEARDDVAMLAVQLEGAPISLAVAPA